MKEIMYKTQMHDLRSLHPNAMCAWDKEEGKKAHIQMTTTMPIEIMYRSCRCKI